MLLGSAAAAERLQLAAAANLNQVLPVLVSKFELAYPQIKVGVTYGASGTLSQQIERGAPYDLFLSASPAYIDYLAKRNLITKRKVFARGRLVLYYRKNLQPAPTSLTDLTRGDINRVVVANPQHAPYGQAAVACLRHYGVYEKLVDRLIYAANVSQAAQMALHGADAALIALPLARNPAMSSSGGFVELPQNCHQPLLQEAAALNDKEAANSFLDFLTSPAAGVILRDYGYDSP